MKNGTKRRAWTSVQVRDLKSMAKKKTPAARIAKKLKRTEGATRQKAFSLGLSLDSALMACWTLAALHPRCPRNLKPRHSRAGAFGFYAYSRGPP